MANNFITCEVKGGDQIQKALEKLARPAAKKIIKAALKAGATPILAEMRREAPKDTGFLSHNFSTKYSLRGGDITGAAFIGPKGRMDYPLKGGRYKEKINARGRKYKSGRISVAAVARFFEFGTEKMGANPFLSRSFQAKREAALQQMIAAFKKMLGLD